MALGDRFSCGFLVTLGGCRGVFEVIVRGHFLVIVRVFVPSPAECQRQFVSLSYFTCVRFLWCPSDDEIRATSLNHRTTKCWLTQRGRNMSAST